MLPQKSIPIERLIAQKVTVLSMSTILEDIDLESYDKATSKYRKPCYQRGLKRPFEWGQLLVESVLEGLSIGSIHLSEWSIIKSSEGVKDYVDIFYNIEDGQTRLNSLIDFKKGRFVTKYGSYEDLEIKERFNAYQLSVVSLSKDNSRVSDADYFSRLNENFSRLQDGEPLTASDRYWSWLESPESDFKGSPIINSTVKLVNDERLKVLFNDFMKVRSMARTDTRKELANMVGLISGAWKGPDYSNSAYYDHVEILQADITQEDEQKIERVLFTIQAIIKEVYNEKCQYPKEQTGAMFKTPSKFTGAMMIHINDSTDEEIADVTKCWVSFINEYRKNKKDKTDKIWEDTVVYPHLSTGHKRNSKKKDLEARLVAVKAWWSKQKDE